MYKVKELGEGDADGGITYQQLQLIGREAHLVVHDEIVRAPRRALPARMRLQVEIKVRRMADVGIDNEPRRVVPVTLQREKPSLMPLSHDHDRDERVVRRSHLPDLGVGLAEFSEGAHAAGFDGGEFALLDVHELGFADAVAEEEDGFGEVLGCAVEGEEAFFDHGF